MHSVQNYKNNNNNSNNRINKSTVEDKISNMKLVPRFIISRPSSWARFHPFHIIPLVTPRERVLSSRWPLCFRSRNVNLFERVSSEKTFTSSFFFSLTWCATKPCMELSLLPCSSLARCWVASLSVLYQTSTAEKSSYFVLALQLPYLLFCQLFRTFIGFTRSFGLPLASV